MRLWWPYDWSEDLPPGVVADVYDGTGSPPRSIDEVEFYVTPYMRGPEPARLMTRMPRLRVVQTLTAGIDTERPHLPDGVLLCNAKGVHDASTAELAVGLIIASLRGLPDYVRNAASGRWDGSRREALADKRVLIVGYG